MNNSEISQLLTMVLMVMLFILVILVCIFIYLKFKSIKQEQKEKTPDSKGNVISSKPKTASYKQYTKQSIFNFMEFDRITDNMICQKNGFRYLMVVGCQGVNYDLMSAEEKLSVEQGFVEFLNTLRYPIQIYVQTRTVNLEGSITGYQKRVRDEEEKLNRMRLNYEQMLKNNTYSEEELQATYFELVKQANLCDYGKDIIANTERMSLNKSVLNKQYYIIIPYYPSELGQNSFDKEEIANIAFSELYTRSQSIISALSSCGVNGKILNSNELLELLYMSYNRDEAEIFGLDKLQRVGFDELYSTAPDVLDKRIKQLNEKIDREAMDLAQSKVREVRSEKQRKIDTMEKNLEDLIEDTAKIILEENEGYLGKEVTKKAKSKIDKDKEARKENKSKEENSKDESIKKKRGRRPKAS